MYKGQTIEYELSAIEYTEPVAENTGFEPVEQREPSHFRSIVGSVAARVALVGAVLGASLTGQGQDQDEAAPVVETTPILVAAQTCYKGGVQGIKVGNLCVTKENPRQPGKCSKTDRFIGNAALGIVTGLAPVTRVVQIGLGLETTAINDYRGGFCD